mgnify:CR=1 FL=1
MNVNEAVAALLRINDHLVARQDLLSERLGLLSRTVLGLQLTVFLLMVSLLVMVFVLGDAL